VRGKKASKLAKGAVRYLERQEERARIDRSIDRIILRQPLTRLLALTAALIADTHTHITRSTLSIMSQQSVLSGLWSHHHHGFGGVDLSIPTPTTGEEQQDEHHNAGTAVAAASTEEARWIQHQDQHYQPESSSIATTRYEEDTSNWAAHQEEQGGQPPPPQQLADYPHHEFDDQYDDDDESPATNIVSVNRSSDHDDDGGDDDEPPMVAAESEEEEQPEDDVLTVETVLHRIESLAVTVVEALDADQMPELVSYQRPFSHEAMTTSTTVTKRMTLQQCRSFTSVILVLAYCHSLLLQSQSSSDRKTTTIREVFYFYVTHFRSQRECDAAIWDACQLLRVPRHALGLQAGSRGWFCGDVRLMRSNNPEEHDNEEVLWDGRAHAGEQGCPIAADWLTPPHQRSFYVAPHNNITCILVVEKEGIYQRLVQDEFWRQHNCILVTGKGFPDLATRACVHALHRQLQVPVRGLADCDPFGVLVLQCYAHGSDRDGSGSGYRVPMEWIGLRPSQVRHLSVPATTTPPNDSQDSEQPPPVEARPTLPPAVFQELTVLDRKRLTEHLLDPEQPFLTSAGNAERRWEELHAMQESKVELEALHWLGLDYCGIFVGQLLQHHEAKQQRLLSQQQQANEGGVENDDDDDENSPMEEEDELGWMDII